MQPLVDDLLKLWEGVQVEICGTTTTIRAVLSCISCDIPAIRKTSGFVGHNALHGCTRCLKSFPVTTFGDKPNFGGFDKENWEQRVHGLHYFYSVKHKSAKTATEQKSIEKEHGVRYSDLPYFDTIRFTTVDPMHLLFLGISKYMMNIWKTQNVLPLDSFLSIQERVNSFKTPTTLGRIPNEISSGFANFTADQWKNWTLYFSLFSLKGFLPPRYYDNWHLFVKICCTLCTPSISLVDLNFVEDQILVFCKQYENIYGQEYLTMNMHLLCHLTDCIRDHGPIYSFWLFPMERMNGILGSFQTNNRNIELQVMRKIVQMQPSEISLWPREYKDDFMPLLQKYQCASGSLLATFSKNDVEEITLYHR